MENGKQPAHPLSDIGLACLKEGKKIDGLGLTKREYFAVMAMQGLCVGKIIGNIKQGECVDIAESSLIIADELLKQLETNK